MKRNMSGLLNEPILSWRCGCADDSPEIPITHACPRCGRQMPEDVRHSIYVQVREELRDEGNRVKARRRRNVRKIIHGVMPVFVIGLIVLAVIGLRWLMPDFFRPVEDWAAGAWEWILGLPVMIPKALGDCWQWLCDAFGAAGEFLMPILGGLGVLLGGLWSAVCGLAGFLWELLLELIRDLPEILGWLWEIVVLLFNQIWHLILFAIEAIPAVFALVIGLIGALLQALGTLLGFLWEVITGIFSLFS